MALASAKIDDSEWSNFQIIPAPTPTPDNARAAKLVDPGFGRVFTDHMAIIRYDQTNGWHNPRIESRANFPLDPAAAVLHYAQEIFEGLKAYQARRRRCEPVSPRRQCPALSGLRRAHGDGAAA